MVATPAGGLLASEAGASGATVYAFSNNSTSHIYGGADCMTCGYIAFDDTFPSMDSLPVPENPAIPPTGSSTLLYTGKDTPQQMELQDTFHFSGPSATAIALPPRSPSPARPRRGTAARWPRPSRSPTTTRQTSSP